MNQLIFALGNLIADLAIGVFAVTVWWHENQETRLRRILAIAASANRITSDEMALIEAYIITGNRERLNEIVTARLDETYGSKLNGLLRSFSVMRALMYGVVSTFPVGIVIESVGLVA